MKTFGLEEKSEGKDRRNPRVADRRSRNRRSAFGKGMVTGAMAQGNGSFSPDGGSSSDSDRSKVQIYLPSYLHQRFQRLQRHRGVSESRLGGELIERAMEEQEAVTMRLFTSAPCGPWSKADDVETRPFLVSPELAAFWGYKEGDALLHVRGLSMMGAGIPEEALLLMRPVVFAPPESGDICAVTVYFDNGDCVGTVKRWQWSRLFAVLRDGNGDTVDWPEGADKIEVNARWTGHMIV